MKWRIRFALWAPFSEVSVVNNKTTMVGIAADSYEWLRQFMNFDYELMVQPDFTYGRKLPNNSWNGMVGAMMNNETDISGPYFVNLERSTAFQYANPLAFSSVSIVSGIQHTQRGAFLLLSIFTLQVWMALVAAVVMVSCAASLTYFAFPSPHKRGKVETLLKYMWIFQIALLGKGLGANSNWYLRHAKSSLSFRLLQGLWCSVCCIVLMNTYQGTIMSTFAVDKPKAIIENLDDLSAAPKMEIGVYKNTYVEGFLSGFSGTNYDSIWTRVKQNSHTPMDPKMMQEGKVPPWFLRVEDGKEVFFSETTYMKRVAGMRFQKTGICKIRVTPIEVGLHYLGIGVRRELSHTTFLRKFNKGLRYFFEADLSHEKIVKSTIHYEICSRDHGHTTKPLKLADVFGAFLILAIGIVFSVILVFLEISVHYFTINKDN